MEILDGKHSAAVVQENIFHSIEVYYNRKRRHSAIDYKRPVEILCEKVA